MKGILISGAKGGTGKTSISHALALGASWSDVNAHVCHTDNRLPMITKGRPYKYYDARSPKYLESLIDSAQSKSGLFIIDGGGNRESFDKWISPSMDLIIIPITPDPEDIKITLLYGDSLFKKGIKNIRYLLNRYPSNLYERKYMQKYINSIPEDMIMGKLRNIPSIRTLRTDDIEEFKTPSSKLNNFCRYVYKLTNRKLFD